MTRRTRRRCIGFFVIIVALGIYALWCLVIYVMEERERIYVEQFIATLYDGDKNDIDNSEDVDLSVRLKREIKEWSMEQTLDERTTKNDTHQQKDDTEVPLEKVDLPKDGDCIIYIPSIELKKVVYTGRDRNQYLEDYMLITAAADMQYIHGGNYVICGHNSQLYGHSLNRLKDVSINDVVYIIQESKVDQYKVSSISYEEMENTNYFCEQNEVKQITILSCAKYAGKNKYIVIKCT